MNQRLLQFALELQSGAVKEAEKKNIYFNKGGHKNFFSFLKSAKVTVPVTKLD